jgi:anti-sigma factor RsiW
MTHPSDIELAAWVDDPGAAGASLAGHVARCEACRETVARIEATRDALALAPPMPSEAEFAAQRARIAAAIGGGSAARRPFRRIAWLAPLAAAAGIAAVVLLGRRGPEAPDSPAGAGTIPLVADARSAAELAVTAILPDEGVVVVPSEAIDDRLLEAALSAEPLAPPTSVEASMTMESRFAELDEEGQSAILLELASADFDL